MFGTRKKKKKTSESSITSSFISTSKKTNVDAYQSTTNRIGQGARIEGEIITDGTIRIEGEIDGYIESKDRVIIGGTGKVIGDIVCNSIDIEGTIKGKIQVADTTFLKASAVVDGEINTNKLVMEAGATFNGNCKTKISTTIPALSENLQNEKVA